MEFDSPLTGRSSLRGDINLMVKHIRLECARGGGRSSAVFPDFMARFNIQCRIPINSIHDIDFPVTDARSARAKDLVVVFHDPQQMSCVEIYRVDISRQVLKINYSIRNNRISGSSA